jgi:hypothetical protein
VRDDVQDLWDAVRARAASVRAELGRQEETMDRILQVLLPSPPPASSPSIQHIAVERRLDLDLDIFKL